MSKTSEMWKEIEMLLDQLIEGDFSVVSVINEKLLKYNKELSEIIAG